MSIYQSINMSENWKGLSERCYPDKKYNLRTCSILDVNTKSKQNSHLHSDDALRGWRVKTVAISDHLGKEVAFPFSW